MSFLDLAIERPHEVAVDDLERQRSWSELVDRVHRIAHLIRDELGVEAGGHVALLLENRVEYPEILLGALFAGVWITPINWHLAPAEVRYILEDSGAVHLFADPALLELVEGSLVPRTVVGRELDARLERVSADPIPFDLPMGGTMVYTSGTTGNPKGVRRFRPPSIEAAFLVWKRVGEVFGFDGSSAHLLTGPMYHAAPGLFALYDLANGAPLVMMRRWDAERALSLIEERRIGHTHMVPTMFVRMLRLADDRREAFDPSSLSMVMHGAAPITPEVKRAMIAWWGETLVEYWGASEGGVYTLIDSAEWLTRPGCVGRAIPSFEVFAVDDEGGRLGAGEVGRLYCRHRERSDVFVYHRAPEKTDGAFLSPGVFTAGDIGRVDAEGWVYLEGRRSDLILSGGVNVYPAEVQKVLAGHPGVSDVAVFGIPDDEWGEVVHAVVEPAPGVEGNEALVAELIEFARARLARFKVPRGIDFSGELPRLPSGKLLVRRIRESYVDGNGKAR